MKKYFILVFISILMLGYILYAHASTLSSGKVPIAKAGASSPDFSDSSIQDNGTNVIIGESLDSATLSRLIVSLKAIDVSYGSHSGINWTSLGD